MPRKITFSRPKRTVAISVTGASCGLDCAHCGAKYLKGMRPPDEALAAFSDSAPKSVLISGGSDAFGHVPMEGWPERIKSMSPDTRVNCHTGVLDEDQAARLKGYADVISFDYVSDERIIEGVYGSRSKAADYVKSFIMASNTAPTVPHVTVGLLGPDEEPALSKKSLQEIRSLSDDCLIPEPPAIVIIALRPTPGTRMQDVLPPSPKSVAEVIGLAKELFPSSQVCLGCMRPSGKYRDELDPMAVDAGADVIVQPSAKARLRAEELGLSVAEDDECCAFPSMDAPKSGMEGENKVNKIKFRPSAGTMAALGLLDIKVDALPTTAYIMLGEKCVRDCAFCAQARNSSAGAGRLSRVTWPEAEDGILLEALGAATRAGKIRRVCLQTVGGRAALDAVCEAVAVLKRSCAEKTAFSVSFSATAGIEDVGRILEAGADRVALALDACNPELHKAIKKADMQASLSLIAKAAARFPGRISTHLISGMGETEQELLSLAAALRDMGVGLGLFAFTPLRGTEMEGHPKPGLASYRRVQLAFWLIKRHGLPISSLSFDDEGRLAGIGLSGQEIERLAEKGDPFETSGCSWCNRPFYNESPGTELYNYPVRLEPEEAKKALSLSLEGVSTDSLEGKE